ncbi:hypothetical protein KEH51_12350 [[Brevibacterium] frigoritolerans]|uniref:Uncharacterized protein n=1 Tax=Peribacillus frigoritolerans TaxID=450367 RepID=A0A941FII0_9BACI|nr:hypothetical protein [Peribacillus frigoritolerans]
MINLKAIKKQKRNQETVAQAVDISDGWLCLNSLRRIMQSVLISYK